MGLIDLASGNSLWRGIEYFQSKKVKNINKINEGEYDSIVSGTDEYVVHIDINHPRKSACTCPFAFDRRVICKHMVATYFTIYPNEAEKIIKEAEEYEEQEEKRYKEHLKDIKEYVDSLTEDEVRAMLIDKIMDEWYNNDYRW
ncbi:MAG: SWIM zinc finger domain-containing protein [Clostridia bacterium]|nr:SWIM zinc finger domain-containing protein [Clostridia bacterium]